MTKSNLNLNRFDSSPASVVGFFRSTAAAATAAAAAEAATEVQMVPVHSTFVVAYTFSAFQFFLFSPRILQWKLTLKTVVLTGNFHFQSFSTASLMGAINLTPI